MKSLSLTALLAFTCITVALAQDILYESRRPAQQNVKLYDGPDFVVLKGRKDTISAIRWK